MCWLFGDSEQVILPPLLVSLSKGVGENFALAQRAPQLTGRSAIRSGFGAATKGSFGS